MPAGHKNPGIIEAEVKMERQVNDCSFLIVEGADDARFWGPRRHSACTLVDGEGKPNVVAAVQRLDGDVGGVLGIVDEDYDCLMGKSLGSSNLMAVSPHDLECFLLCHTPALDSVLAEFGVRTKIVSFEARESTDVRTALLHRASHFGQLRWAAQACGLNIRSDEIRIRRFLDEKTWEVDRPGLIRAAAADLEDELERCIGRLPKVQPWRLVRGHDVLEVLRIGLRNVLGDSSVGVRDIARVLRAAGRLEGTTLLEEIQRWEEANLPYLVLGGQGRPNREAIPAIVI